MYSIVIQYFFRLYFVKVYYKIMADFLCYTNTLVAYLLYSIVFIS